MTHLDTLRTGYGVALCTAALKPGTPVDPDLAAEAGPDENFARLLQAARYLDEDAQTRRYIGSAPVSA